MSSKASATVMVLRLLPLLNFRSVFCGVLIMAGNLCSGNAAAEPSGFLNYLRNLPSKSETTVRFFNRSDYYTVHGEDAWFVAKEVFKSTNNIKTYGSGNNRNESLVINKNQFENLVKDLLLVRHYRIEVYTARPGTNNSDWFLEFRGSPGNLSQFEDLLFGSDNVVTGATVMAIKTSGDAKNRTIGVATVEVADRVMTVSQFQDDDNLTELEGFIVQTGPKEILIPDSDKSISKIASRCGALVSNRKSSEFTNDGLTQDLNRLLEWKPGQAQNSSALPAMKLMHATSCLNAVLKYLELSGNESNFNQFTLSVSESKRFVHVDTSAAKALGLIPMQTSAVQQTLVGFLDRCRTPQGRRLISQWVKQPLRDLRSIAERQDVVAALMDDSELRMNLSEEHLRRFPDLQLLARRLQRKNSSMQDCYKIYQAVEQMTPLLTALSAAEYCAAVKSGFIDSLTEFIEDMSKFQEMISSTLDFEQVAKGEFLVKPEFSEDLAELREKLDHLENEIQKEFSRSAKDLLLEAGKNIKLDCNSQLGHHFRTASKKEEKQIRNNPRFKLLDVTKAGIRFQSRQLTALSEDHLDTKKSYDECQKSVVEEIMNIAVGYTGAILSINGVIAKLDVLTSLALTAANAPTPYVRPILRPAEDGVLKLKQARHPILEVQDSISFIPNDIDMDKNGTTFYIITGPNMGGKSTYIRTVGVVVLLAHIGSFVPCDSAEISLTDAILSRIGSGDCQLIGVSTFMNEMVETSAIIRRVTKESLVMIDELGRGTSTYEGCGLAWAIAKHLAVEIKAFSLFATHFQELTALPDEVPTAANFHVTASAGEEDFTLLYQVRPGQSDRSFGLEVARMARFKEHVIERARIKQVELEQRQGLGITDVSLTPTEIQEGEKLVRDFLRLVQEKGLSELESIKEEILGKKNRYITAILS